ncbi:MAG: class I SAM-dependent methyltransferase [Dehalococcoidales bacterium]|jgi:SAM-dependent methyltransferase
MYNPEYTRTFYNAYGPAEWARLEATAYGRLQAVIHEDFIRRYLKHGDRVLDAGSGPGRFSILAARAGARVTALDISDKQLEIAGQKIAESGQTAGIERCVRADICDLSLFPDGRFDMVICFGAVLTYVCEKRRQAAAELVRVTRPGGVILVGVGSKLGAVQGVAQQPDLVTLKEPDKPTDHGPALWDVLASGDLSGFPSRAAGMMHAPMHLFTAAELQALFTGCEILETAGSNVALREYAPSNERVAADPAAWAAVVELEKKINHDPGLVNCGSHIIMAVRKKP